MKQAQACPIANALSGAYGREENCEDSWGLHHVVGATVTLDYILCTLYSDDEVTTVEIPTMPDMRTFISAFDRGLLPKYQTKKVKRVGHGRNVPGLREESV
jgi:hypothetical protein